jgi:hypothetical protein
MFEVTDSMFDHGLLNRHGLLIIHGLRLSQSPQTFLTNPSKLRIYLCKIPTVITETLTA